MTIYDSRHPNTHLFNTPVDEGSMCESPFILLIVRLSSAQVKRKWQYNHTVFTVYTAKFISIVTDLPVKVVGIFSSLLLVHSLGLTDFLVL